MQRNKTKAIGHSFNLPLDPLSSSGRTAVAKIFKIMRESDMSALFTYDWIPLHDLVPQTNAVIFKFIPKFWTINVCYFGGSLVFRFQRMKGNKIINVYVSQKDFRHLNFTIKRIIDASN